MIDNDCDGRVDEELANSSDDDGDSAVDEDTIFAPSGTNVLPEAYSASRTLPDSNVAIVLSAFDENLDPLSYTVVSLPTHGLLRRYVTSDLSATILTTSAPVQPVVRYIPDANYNGSDSFTFRVNDGTGNSSAATISLTMTSVNDTPRITSSPTTTATEESAYSYTVAVSDPDSGQSRTYALLEAPAGMTINGSGVISWTPTNQQVGLNTVHVRVTDAGGSIDMQRFVITVANTNDAPDITSTALTTAKAGVCYHYQVLATDADLGDVLRFSISGPTGMTIDRDTGLVDWTPIGVSGNFSIVVTAKDLTNLTDTQSYTLNVAADTIAPTVQLSMSANAVNSGGPITFQVTGRDNIGSPTLALEVDSTPVTLDANGRATINPTAVGIHSVEATATDAASNVTTVTRAFTVRDSSDVTSPTVELTAPIDDEIITEPVAIEGTASDTNLVEVQLSIREGSEGEFTPIKTSVSGVTAGELGVFDPTLLENGLYQLRLEATDVNGQTSATTVNVQVQGGMKVGVFTLSFVDLQIPVSGIPITVTRTYDSRVKSQRHFGIGWSLDVAAGKYHHNRKPGEGWTLEDPPGLFTLPCSDTNELTNHRTEVRLSDREWYSFAATVVDAAPTVGGCSAQMGFTQVDGYAPGATLEVLSNPFAFQEASGDELFDDETFVVWNPSQVRLTTYDGRVIDFERGVGITAIEDLSGNRIDIGPGGISSSTGKSITFTRDPEGRIVEIEDPMSNTLTYQYDAAGELARFTNQLGNITDFFYDDRHNLVDIVDPIGVRAVRNEYDNDGRLIATIDPTGNRFSFEHDLVNRRETLTNRLGYTTLMDYDARGNIVLETYPGSPTVTKARTYDARDNVLTETNEEDETTTWTYNDRNLKLTETNAMDETKSWTYTARGLVETFTDARDEVTSYTYDSAGLELTRTDPEGFVTRKKYNSRGDQIRECDPRGFCTSMAFDSVGNQTRVANRRARTTYYTFNANGAILTETTTRAVSGGGTESLVTTHVVDALSRETQVTSPDGSVRRTIFDARGDVVETVDPLGRSTTLGYDAEARRVLTRYPDQTTRELSYDAEGRLASRTDRLGRITTMLHDDRGRLVEESFDGATIDLTYDDAGRLIEVRDRLNHLKTMVYDDAGRLVELRTALDEATLTSYDEAGNILTTTDPKDRTTSYTYDGRSLRTRVDYPDSTFESMVYDGAGNEVASTDQGGRSRAFTYDGESNLTSVTGPDEGTWSFAYDEQNNLISQTDPLSHATTFKVDKMRRETSRRFAIDDPELRENDGAYNLIERTRYSGSVTSFDYDENDWPSARHQPEGTVTMEYSPTGQRLAAVDDRGSTRYFYDSHDRLANVIYPDGQSLAYSYDAESNLVALTGDTGLDTWTDAFAFDELNRIEAVNAAGLSFGLSYDETGQLATITYPNGLVTTYTHDELDRIESITVRDGATVLTSLEYTRTPSGMVESIEEEDGRLTEYEYDSADRLISEHVTIAAAEVSLRAYEYDDAGNRTEVSYTPAGGSPAVQSCTFDQRDRLLTQGSTSFGWDEDGRVSSRGGAAGYEPTWDSQDQLVHLDYASGAETSFAYDVDGVLMEESFTSPTGDHLSSMLLTDGRGRLSQVVAETDGANGALVVRYVRAGDLLLAAIRGSDVRFFHPDHVGSTRSLSDELGEITDRYVYDPFGAMVSHEGDDPSRYLFGGQRFDPSRSLSYNRARWMDPAMGRFLSIDPDDGALEAPASLARYPYANNAPSTLSDPTGLFAMMEMMLVATDSGKTRATSDGAKVRLGARIKTAAEAFRRGKWPRPPPPPPWRGPHLSILFPGADTPKTTAHIEANLEDNPLNYLLHYLGKNMRKPSSWIHSRQPCGSTDACDEYPFATTHEGGVENFPARVTLKCVPRSEQNRQGGIMRDFYGTCLQYQPRAFLVMPAPNFPKTEKLCGSGG